MNEPLDTQVARLASYILAHHPDATFDGGACDVAIEVMKAQAAHADYLAGAIHSTQEYVGAELLPAIEGWSWWDALQAHAAQGGVVA